MAEQNVGKVVAIIGPVLDIEFPGGQAPGDLQRRPRPGRRQGDGRADRRHRRGRPAARRERRALRLDEADRRHGARHEGRGPRRADLRARRPRDARAHPERHRRPGRRARPGQSQGALADPPRAARLRRAGDLGRDVRDRHQGHRPARALHQGRQDRPLRRRRRRQDRHDPGAHQQRRHAPRRLLGLLGRGRAHARGQRPLPRDDGVGRHHAGRSRRSRRPR